MDLFRQLTVILLVCVHIGPARAARERITAKGIAFPCDIEEAQKRAGLVIAPEEHGVFEKTVGNFKRKAAQQKLFLAIEGMPYHGRKNEEYFQLQLTLDGVRTRRGEALIQGIEEDFSYSASATFLDWLIYASGRIPAEIEAVPMNLRDRVIEERLNPLNALRDILNIFIIYQSPRLMWQRVRRAEFADRKTESVAAAIDLWLLTLEGSIGAQLSSVDRLVESPAFTQEPAVFEVLTKMVDTYAAMCNEPEYQVQLSAPDFGAMTLLTDEAKKNDFSKKFVVRGELFKNITEKIRDWRDITMAHHIAKLYCEAAHLGVNLVFLVGREHRGILIHLAAASGNHQLEYSEVNMKALESAEKPR